MRTLGQIIRMLQDMHARPNLEGLAGVFREVPALFYEIAFVDFDSEMDDEWKPLFQAARELRKAVLNGYQVTALGNGQAVVESNGGIRLPFQETAIDVVRELMKALDGRGWTDRAEKSFAGDVESEAALSFHQLTSQERLETELAVKSRLTADPVLLRLDAADLAELSLHPPYVIHELKRCAVATVQAPIAVFEGLRDRGELANGRAYCRLPLFSFGNDGMRADPLVDKTYIVYVTNEGYIFDWDWVESDPKEPGLPLGWRKRFRRRIENIGVAGISDVDAIIPGHFDQTRPWYSRVGDCLFCYFSDEPSYAKRATDRLTVFYSRKDEDVVGFKLKHVQDIVFELGARKLVQIEGGEVSVDLEKLIIGCLISMRTAEEEKAYGKLWRDWRTVIEKIPPIQIPVAA